MAASNVVKANRMMIAKFTMNAYKKSKITKTEKKKKKNEQIERLKIKV